jgi:required for meiotic nuclear division protein 1
MADISTLTNDLIAFLGAQRPIAFRALLLGERIDTHRFDRQEPLGRAPLAIGLREGGVAVLFRYGVAVLANVSPEGEKALVERLAPFITDPFEPRESDELRVSVKPEAEDQIGIDGGTSLRDVSLEKVQLIADVLAKSLVLSHYEINVAIGFDRIEPMAETLRRRGRLGIAGRPLLRQIGTALMVQHKMVGRVETAEKPDLLWDHPELERFYARLAEEYELRERSRALDHKQDVILRTSEMMLGLVQERSNLRVEWYIVLLIVAELVITAYSLMR